MYELPLLPYGYDALEPHIDQMTMRIHHDKHHAAYVENLNKSLEGTQQNTQVPIEELIKDVSKLPESIRTKVRNHGGGHANHSFFWNILCPVSSYRAPSGPLLDAINKTFESLEKMQQEFSARAMGRFGSGWTWLVYANKTLAITDTPNQDSPYMEGSVPIIGLDVWEHAYYLKYQNLRAEYIKNWWHVVCWSQAEAQYTKLVK